MSTPTRSFRRRFRQTQMAHAVLAAIFIVVWIAVDWSLPVWIITCVVFALACLAVEYRGQQCPHCRGLVLGGISEDVGISLLGPPPRSCRTCGGNLADDE